MNKSKNISITHYYLEKIKKDSNKFNKKESRKWKNKKRECLKNK